jgi:ribosomal protein L11 methylase PrmA
VIKSLVKPDGYLILAGILTQEYRDLRDAFAELGFREICEATEDEWTSGLFIREGE